MRHERLPSFSRGTPMSTSVASPLPLLRRYGAIYADPPGSFRNWSAKGNRAEPRLALRLSRLQRTRGASGRRPGGRPLRPVPLGERSALAAPFELIAAWGFAFKAVGFY